MAHGPCRFFVGFIKKYQAFRNKERFNKRSLFVLFSSL